MIAEFMLFLQEHDLVKPYFTALDKRNKELPFNEERSVNSLMFKRGPDSAIGSAFIWAATPEKANFWAKYNTMWEDKVKFIEMSRFLAKTM